MTRRNQPPAPESNFAVVWRFLRPYSRRLLGIVLLTVLLSLLAMLPPLLVRAIVDRVLTAGRANLLPGLAVAMALVPILAALARYLQTIGIAAVGQRFVFDMRVALYRHLLGLSLRFFGRESTGKLINRLMGDSGVVQRVLTGQTITAVSDLVCAAFAISFTFLLNWRLALVLNLLVLIFVLNYRLNIGRLRQVNRTYQASLDRLSGGVQNRLVGALAIKTFGTETREHDIFSGQLEHSLGRVQESFLISNRFSMNTQLIQHLGRAIIYFLGCALVLRDELSYGDVIAFSTYAMQLLHPAVRFSEIARSIQEVQIAVERLIELYREPPEVVSRPDARRVTRLRGAVVFERVRFHYDEDTPVLRDFQLTVQPGQTIALIGPTGCGKSTILSLLMRFYDVTGGRLLLDGVDVRDYEVESLRRQFGIVLQDPLLFKVSIADNIRYARPDAPPASIEQAARVAEIHDFIQTLPQGYDTLLGEEGVDLSLGQKQRLTIARAVAADPAILVMDEATSALDTDSERAIQRALERVLKGRTSFIVAHRLSTIRNASQIVLLDKGRIVEQGHHDELMADRNGRYRRLYLTHMDSGSLAT